MEACQMEVIADFRVPIADFVFGFWSYALPLHLILFNAWCFSRTNEQRPKAKDNRQLAIGNRQ
jgi:flagellar biogenesis protein FliO